jgi:PKD repeat protein
LAAGTDTSGDPAPFNFIDDLLGDTRTTWTVGALELAAPPPATVTKTVGPGKDYTSLIAFDAGEQRNLTTVDEIARALCANFEDTTKVLIDGWTTDEARHIIVEAEDDHLSRGQITTNAYRLVISGFGTAIDNRERSTRFIGIQAKISTAAFLQVTALSNQLTGVLWDRCVGEIGTTTHSDSTVFRQGNNAGIATMRNCFAYRPNAGRAAWCFDDTLRIYSCTLIGSVIESGIAPTIICKNCYAAGRGSDAYGTGVNVAETNASDDATGNVGLRNIALDDTTFNNVAARDFRLAIGSPLLDIGNDTSDEPFPLDFTEDILQVTRVGWSVGAYEEFVPPPPIASFTADPESGLVPLEVDFTNTSVDADTYFWEFGDTNTSTEENPTHTFTSIGTFTVKLTATNAEGSDEFELDITVNPVAPVASFVATPADGPTPLEVRFTNTSIAEASTYLWDFGDNTTSSEENPTHTYTVIRSYIVRLTVTNVTGSDFFEDQIDVLAAPVPKVPENTWGALFHARAQPQGLAVARQEILDRGFTILDERSFSGFTQICGYGNTASMMDVVNDPNFKFRVHSFFFELPVGEDLTLSLIQNWTDHDENVVR